MVTIGSFDINLVPKSSWYKSLKGMLSDEEWRSISKREQDRAGHKCEICGFRSRFEYGLQCHELWEYDDVNHIQKLIGYKILCQNCHLAHHLGYANVRGKLEKAKEWILRFTNISREELNSKIQQIANEWTERSKYGWKIDLTFEKEVNLKRA